VLEDPFHVVKIKVVENSAREEQIRQQHYFFICFLSVLSDMGIIKK